MYFTPLYNYDVLNVIQNPNIAILTEILLRMPSCQMLMKDLSWMSLLGVNPTLLEGLSSVTAKVLLCNLIPKVNLIFYIFFCHYIAMS